MFYIKAALESFFSHVCCEDHTDTTKKKRKCVLIHFLCDAFISRKPWKHLFTNFSINLYHSRKCTLHIQHIRCFDSILLIYYHLFTPSIFSLYYKCYCYTHICILFTLHHFPHKYIFTLNWCTILSKYCKLPTSITVSGFGHFSIMIKCMSSESLQRSSGYYIALLKGCPRLRIPLKDPPDTWLSLYIVQRISLVLS